MNDRSSDWMTPGVMGRLPAEVRNPLLTTNLWIGGVGGSAIVLLSGVGNPRFDVLHPTFLALTALHAMAIAMAIWRSGPYLLRTAGLGLVCFAWGAILLAYVGPAGLVYLYLLVCTLLGGSLYGLRGFVVSFAGVIALFTLAGYGWSKGVLPLEGSYQPDLRNLRYWVLPLGGFLCAATMISGMVHFLLKRTARHLAEEVRMAESLALEQRRRSEAELTRLREELARQEAETRLATMLRAAPIGIALVKEGRLSLVNDRMAEMFGDAVGTMTGRTLASLFRGSSADGIAREIAMRFGDGQLMALESATRTRTGAEMWVSITAIPLDASRPEAGMVATFSDITASRHAAELLREREERLREIFDHTGEIIFSIRVEGDERFVIERVNRAAAKYGFDLAKVNSGRLMLSEVFPAEVARRLELNYAACARSREALQTEQAIDLPAGRFHFATTLVPIPAPDASRVVRVIGMARDVTAERRSEELERARAMADAANRAKSVFLSHMSHEIRTPLNAILGFTRLLHRDTAPDARQREPLEIIHRNGEHLLSLINDILEISTIEAGRVVLREATFSLGDVLEEVRGTFAPVAAARGLSLRWSVAPECPGTIQADRGKLRQILVNLVENALKFTATGGVEVAVTSGTIAGRTGLVIAVADTGPGIAPEERVRLFQPFEQTASGRLAGGSGLGLAISRSFARLLGGDLVVESRVGAGSVFTLTLPCAGPGTRPVGADEPRALVARDRMLPASLAGVPVLVVDDVADNRAVLTRFLERAGFATRAAADGREALAIASTWRPRAVVLDMRLPDAETADLVRLLRAGAEPGTLAILGLSASVFAEDQSRFATTGVDAFLPKPFEDDAVLDALARLVGVAYAEPTFERPVSDAVVVSSGRPLDGDTCRAVLRAAEESDYVALRGLIEQVKQADTGLGAELGARLQRFDYDGMRSLLGEGRSP